MIGGISRALADGRQQLGISSCLILCFLRHLSEEEALATFEQALPHRALITGFGLDSSEVGHPPEKFARVFEQVRQQGFRVVAHAGEEGPAEYIWQALNLLQVERIDHGVRCQDDPALVAELKARQMPLTVCPLSNLKLKVVTDMRQHNLAWLLEQGLCATVNSDDPAYFGGYMNANFEACRDALELSDGELKQLAANSFRASFLPEAEKQRWLETIQAL